MTDINLLQKGDLKESDFTNDNSNNKQGIGVRLSSDGGNLLQQRKNGLYYGIEAAPDTPTLDLVLAGNNLSLVVNGVADTVTLPTTVNDNAPTATKLQTARTINGVAFDGTQNITIVDSTKLPSNGNAVSASKLQTARTINGVAFDGSADITINTALKAVQRTERTGTLIPTNNSFKNLTVDVTGVVEIYPDGRIVQFFSFIAPVRYFHRHSAQAFYRTTLGVANFTVGEDSPILEMPLWTAMPNKVSEARVHLSSGPAYHAYSEANEWVYDWDAIFNQQANIKDKAYFSFRRWVGGTDEPVTFNIVVEGY